MQAPPFLPDDLGEWLSALVVIVGALASSVAILLRAGRKAQSYEDEVKSIRREMEDRFTTRGERIGRVEDGVANLTGKVEALHAADIAFQLEVNTNGRELGRIDGEVSGVQGALRALERAVASLHLDLGERLARIEERTGGTSRRKHTPE